MVATVIPTIQQGKVVRLFISFDKPLSFSTLKDLLEKLKISSNSSTTDIEYKPASTKYPIYSNGEIIAVVEKHPDGTTKRTYV